MQVRSARQSDVDRLVEIEFDRYAANHAVLDTDRQEVRGRFRRRLDNVPSWAWVVEVDGRVEGCISGMRTSVAPQDIASWEQTGASGRAWHPGS